MFVVLINPPSPWANEPAMSPQLGLCYVSSALKSEGYKVQGIDFGAMKFDYYHNVYLLKIPSNSEIYGIYCMSAQFKWVKEICRYIRKVNPKAIIFVGGPHATSCPEDFKDLADHVVKGYGEWAINEYLNVETATDDRPILIPDRSIFDKYDYHRTINGEKAHHIITLRGCPYSCNYCDKKSVGTKVQYIPIEIVLKEIDSLMEQHNTRSFVIYDDIFTLDKKRLETFCVEFRRRNLQWRCWARTDLVNEENLTLMKDSGLASITFGVESGDDNVLKRINKKATVKDNWNALSLCKDLGIPVRCSLMFGNPGENSVSLIHTINMIEQCQPDEWNLAILAPTPGSAFWDYPEKYGISFDKQFIINNDYQMLNRFQGTGIGNIICSIDSCPDDELEELLPWFVGELERICIRQKIQDTIQEIKL